MRASSSEAAFTAAASMRASVAVEWGAAPTATTRSATTRSAATSQLP